MFRLSIFGYNHAVQDLDSVIPQQVVVAEAEVDDMANERMKVNLTSLEE